MSRQLEVRDVVFQVIASPVNNCPEDLARAWLNVMLKATVEKVGQRQQWLTDEETPRDRIKGRKNVEGKVGYLVDPMLALAELLKQNGARQEAVDLANWWLDELLLKYDIDDPNWRDLVEVWRKGSMTKEDMIGWLEQIGMQELVSSRFFFEDDVCGVVSAYSVFRRVE